MLAELRFPTQGGKKTKAREDSHFIGSEFLAGTEGDELTGRR